MNTKKLIGMILGVTMFAALIAGATFAFLTLTATVTNNAYTNLASRNFTFSYTNGSAISEFILLTQTPARNSITATKGYLTLDISKSTNSAKASSFVINLHKTTWQPTVTGLVRYAVCRSDTASDCNNTVATTIPASATGNWVAVGTIDNSTGDQALYTDTTTFNVIGAKTAHYYIYFWIDASVINETNLSGADNKTIDGYVFAEATQGE